MIRGAAATGIINLVAAAIVSIFLLRQVVSVRQLVTALCALAAPVACAGSGVGMSAGAPAVGIEMGKRPG